MKVRTQKNDSTIQNFAMWGMLGSILLMLFSTGCSSNFVVRHKSLYATKAIHVYVDQKLVCIVTPQQKCERYLKPGRHVFFAEVKGKSSHKWGKKSKPTPFSVDQKTIIDLHDPRTATHKHSKK